MVIMAAKLIIARENIEEIFSFFIFNFFTHIQRSAVGEGF